MSDHEIIERGAEALYLHDASNASTRWSGWQFATVTKQQTYRDRAEVVIMEARKLEKTDG